MTKQRKLVYEVLKKQCRHLTADEIFTILKDEGEKLVFATVYNSLNYLVSNGYVRKIHTPSGADCYDGNLMPHDHFICGKCGGVIDVKSIKRNLNKVELGNNRICSCETTYYGVCEHCVENN